MIKTSTSKVGRNSPCPCGSGRKYKKCCGHPVTGSKTRRVNSARHDQDAKRLLNALRAKEIIRERQQGRGKQIISTEIQGHRIVVAGNTIYHSPKWKVFPDFLSAYIKTVMGGEWGEAELKKPFEQQHILMKWYRAYCEWQAAGPAQPRDQVRSMEGTGAVWCYIGLAYSLYLIKHNVELQDRLVKRLRDPLNFQGAYYELIVANLLVRAGFKLSLEDEQDNANKHCEFSAISPTGKKYWIEAKMRSVAGVLGKTAIDGSTGKDPTEKLTDHLRQAMRKPADGERLIFIDLNTPGGTPGEHPAWVDRAVKRLEESSKGRTTGESAYIFITNMNYHHHMTETSVRSVVMAYGYGIPDFEKAGNFRLSELYRQRQKHKDAFAVLDSFSSYTKFPITFDGSLPSDAQGTDRRIAVGEKYVFGEPGTEYIAEVTSAIITDERELVVAVYTVDNRSLLLKSPATEQQYREYKEFGEAVFGHPRRANAKTNDIYELFLWLLDNLMRASKEQLLQQAHGAPDITHLTSLSKDDLAVELAERRAMAILTMNEHDKSKEVGR